ncbi:MAG: tRNA (adenosine(37)-N6)-dimethylallyltransferase MiaA [Paludibacteraceae bacterium]|nr:tRNA (adenosine(37)-N6)-dimethylallyltransferase MiaA [Paludibacteraceae bacterium]
MKTLLVIVGPTGVGKTELSLRAAEHYGCPILNADSRQIYRDLPIGTAAPTKDDRQRVKHYFVGTHELDETYNAGQFERDCLEVISGQLSDVGILSGGSMMYIDSVCKGLDDIPDVPSKIREDVQAMYRAGGLEALQEAVQQLDSDYWNEVDQHNPQRLMHCIEVCRVSGQPYSSFRRKKVVERPFRIVKIGLERSRDELYHRIDTRVDEMMQAGLLEEARRAYVRFKDSLPNSLNTVGYKELIAYFRGETDLDEAIRLIKQNSRHYAKRQMTWFRQDKDIHWLDATISYEEQIRYMDACLNG